MSDLFHVSQTSQLNQPQQIGLSNRDVGGSQIVVGAGARIESPIHVENLDPAALNVAAIAVHDALQANTATSLGAFTAFQRALTVTGETASGALQLASSGGGSGAIIPVANGYGPAPAVNSGLNPSTLIWVGGAVLAAVIIIGIMRR